MIDIAQIKNFFPVQMRENVVVYKYMVKEYVQLLILDYLSTARFDERKRMRFLLSFPSSFRQRTVQYEDSSHACAFQGT